MAISIFGPEDYEIIDKAYADLEVAVRKRCANDQEVAVVRKAFDFANEAHKNVRRRSGEPYILHPIAVAKIVVSEIGLGYKSISAALLHDVVEDTDHTVDDIRSQFGDRIALIVDGLTKIKNVFDAQEEGQGPIDKYKNSIQAENFKRILLTLNDDVRVVLIKLADRLHNCRTIEFMPENKRDKILSETMFIFIPLAHRLGFYSIKTEMENIWLKFKEPETYREISERVEHDASLKAKDVDHFLEVIKKSLDGKFDYQIKKRIKSAYSIWRKMQVKHVPFDEIYDLYAIRIIFNPNQNTGETEKDQCFHIYSILTSIFKSKPDRLRDWVSEHKSNGYEALHCTLQDKETGINVEVQIRSKRMDDIAEKGIAAHWAYKKEGYIDENDSEMDLWLEKIKTIISSPDINALELLDIVHKDLTLGEIIVFTPKHEQKRIPKGSTALDFAYYIHTEIGHKAIAAKINMKLTPLSKVLKSGDIVEIITAEDAQPKKENLHFLQSRNAKNKVLDWLRHEGKSVADVRDDLFLEGNNPAETHFEVASCCCPIAGDPILGFRTPEGKIMVHKKSCKVAEGIAATHGDWIVMPQWRNLRIQSFLVRVKVGGLDRMGLLNEITRYISFVMGVNIKGLNISAIDGIMSGTIDLFVHDKDVLEELMSKLKNINGITSVIRSDLQ